MDLLSRVAVTVTNQCPSLSPAATTSASALTPLVGMECSLFSIMQSRNSAGRAPRHQSASNAARCCLHGSVGLWCVRQGVEEKALPLLSPIPNSRSTLSRDDSADAIDPPMRRRSHTLSADAQGTRTQKPQCPSLTGSGAPKSRGAGCQRCLATRASRSHRHRCLQGLFRRALSRPSIRLPHPPSSLPSRLDSRCPHAGTATLPTASLLELNSGARWPLAPSTRITGSRSLSSLHPLPSSSNAARTIEATCVARDARKGMRVGHGAVEWCRLSHADRLG